VPLKRWYKEQYRRRNWTCYYTPEPGVVTIFEEDRKFRMYEVTLRDSSQMGGQIEATHFAEGDTFNEDGIPTQVDETGRCLTPQWVPTQEEAETDYYTFEEYLDSLPEWEQDLIGNAAEINDGTKVLIELLSELDGHRHIYGASDGGLRKIIRQYGSQGWVVATHQATPLWRGSGPANGTPNSSYRTEGCGIIGFLRFLHHFIHYWKVVIPVTR
jgi:hypothetical protein